MSGTLVLDSEALSELSRRHRDMTVWLDVARRLHLLVVTSAAALVEARDPEVPQTAFDHAVSLAKVRPVTEEIARAASRLLAAESLHGHKYAIDAMLAAAAHMEHGDVTVITSDVAEAAPGQVVVRVRGVEAQILGPLPFRAAAFVPAADGEDHGAQTQTHVHEPVSVEPAAPPVCGRFRAVRPVTGSGARPQ